MGELTVSARIGPGRLAASARVGPGRLDVAFTVAAGEVLAVVGPNGAGKSTAAAVVAGLRNADEAVVRVGNRTLTDTSRQINVAVCDRRVGLLAQDPMLFPHMSVLGNVSFAARPPAGRRVARTTAWEWLDRVGAADLATRKPAELSGGEAQRVALARALAAEPDVLVLDEPLTGLDVAGAAAVRAALRDVLAAHTRPTLLITHDLPDVLALADRVLVMQDGAVAETGRVTEVLSAPRSRFGARFAGLNMARGVLGGPAVVHTTDGQDWHGVAAEPLTVGQDAVAVFSPAAVAVHRRPPQGSPRNVVCGHVAALEATGTAIRVRLAEHPDASPPLAADITAEALAELRLGPGEQVWFSVKTQAVTLYPGGRART